jgi:RNA recognition motif-containing protein
MHGKRRSDNDKDTEQFRKLFIGGLSLSTTEERLRSYFEQWGELVDAVVMKDRQSNRSRGFGFVTYRDPEMVDAAQSNRPHEIDGKVVESKRAMPREESNQPESHTTVNRLFVGSLRKDAVADDLRTVFSKYGNITDCEVVCWKETGESRGFGFVTFDDYDPVDKIMLNKPHYLNSNRIEVKKALSKDQMNDIKRKQESDRNGPPPSSYSRNAGMYDRSSNGAGMRNMYANGQGASLMGYPDPYMDRQYDDRMVGGYGSMSGWGDMYDRAQPMRAMDDFGQYGGQRRFSGGPMRDSQSYSRSAPYRGGGRR